MDFKFFHIFLFAPIYLAAFPGYFEPWGKDADLLHSQPRIKNIHSELSLPAELADLLIVFHQKVITKADGPRSHFRPTSSRYMQLAIHRYGFWKGFIMGCDRLMRENSDPWIYRTIMIDGKMYKWDPIYKK